MCGNCCSFSLASDFYVGLERGTDSSCTCASSNSPCDITCRATYRWVDGSSLVHYAWNGEEPNSATRQCVTLGSNALLKDASCTSDLEYVCKRQLVTTQAIPTGYGMLYFAFNITVLVLSSAWRIRYIGLFYFIFILLVVSIKSSERHG